MVVCICDLDLGSDIFYIYSFYFWHHGVLCRKLEFFLVFVLETLNSAMYVQNIVQAILRQPVRQGGNGLFQNHNAYPRCDHITQNALQDQFNYLLLNILMYYISQGIIYRNVIYRTIVFAICMIARVGEVQF